MVKSLSFNSIIILLVFLLSFMSCSDLDKVQAGIGDKLAVFFQWIVTFFAGIAVGFALDWRLTLVILGMTPFLAAAAVAMAKVCTTRD